VKKRIQEDKLSKPRPSLNPKAQALSQSSGAVE
jgi:hypothetical protein